MGVRIVTATISHVCLSLGYEVVLCTCNLNKCLRTFGLHWAGAQGIYTNVQVRLGFTGNGNGVRLFLAELVSTVFSSIFSNGFGNVLRFVPDGSAPDGFVACGSSFFLAVGALSQATAAVFVWVCWLPRSLHLSAGSLP